MNDYWFQEILYNNDGSLFNVVVSVVMATYVSFLLMFFSRYQRKRKNKELDKNHDFLILFFKGIEKGVIVSLNDVYNLYKGSNDLELENDNYREQINNYLREALVSITKNTKEFYDGEIDINYHKKLINSLLIENEKLAPFSLLPETERIIFNDMISYLDLNDTKSVRRKLDELSSSIQVRKNLVNKLEKQNRWSIPLTIVGFLLTVFFGSLSIL